MDLPHKEINPQKENGHVDIANEIVEALAKTYLSSYESQILWAIFRKTYGWHKKEDWISISQLVDITGIYKSHISRTIKKLLERNMIFKNGNKIGFQKRYDRWQRLPKQVTAKKLPIQDKKLPKQAYTKETSTKETSTKETIKRKSQTYEKFDEVFQLTLYLEGKIRENNKAIKKRSDQELQKWCEDIDKLIRIDKAKPEEIKKVIDWVVRDEFWSMNILSAKKLRKHYPRFWKTVIDRGQSLEDYRWEDDPTMEFLKYEKEGGNNG